jgi:hypothetical protein
MTIFQVLNEENQLYCEFTEVDKAMQSAQDLTALDDGHFYHVEELELSNS